MDKAKRLPRHIAIIMDGNGRWARQRGLSRLEGHCQGVSNALKIVELLLARDVEFVSLYSFSTENWRRPRDEVAGLLDLMAETIEKEIFRIHEQGVRIWHLGRSDRLPGPLKEAVDGAVALTAGNSRMTLALAFDYGARDEMVDAVRRIVADGIAAASVDEATLTRCFYSPGLPDVDLLIRTGGEFRISNFLLWQIAYSELYFTPVLWPEFNEAELDKALREYARRERRFGGLGADNLPPGH